MLNSRAGVAVDDETRALRAGRAGAQDAMIFVIESRSVIFWLYTRHWSSIDVEAGGDFRARSAPFEMR